MGFEWLNQGLGQGLNFDSVKIELSGYLERIASSLESIADSLSDLRDVYYEEDQDE